MEVQPLMKLPKSSLAQQCEGIGWSLTDLSAQKYDTRSWSIDGETAGLPEEVEVADNVRGALEAIDKNEEFIKMTLAVMMTPE